MADRRKVLRFERVESEDSDEEFVTLSHGSRSGSVIEDLLYEIDVTRHYKKILGINRPSPKSPRAAVKSTAIQTDVDVSGLPPLWSKSLLMLVDQVHTDIGNLINSLFHSPSRGVVANCQILTFFDYVDGFWQSKYFPHIKIPASVFETRIYSGTLESDLKRLFRNTELLKSIASYVQDYECSTSRKDRQETMPENVRGVQASFSGRLKQAKRVSLGKKAIQPVASSSGMPDQLSSSSKCGCSSNAYRLQVSFPKMQKSRSAGKPKDNSSKIGFINGCKVSSRRPEPLSQTKQSSNIGVSRGVRVSLQAANLHSAAGQQRSGKENCPRPKVHPTKNFIQRNIVAVRDPVIRVRMTSGRSRPVCI